MGNCDLTLHIFFCSWYLHIYINHSSKADSLVELCSQETKGVILETMHHGGGRNDVGYYFVARYNVDGKNYQVRGRQEPFTAYLPGQSTIVHFNPNDHSMSYAGERPYHPTYWPAFVFGAIFLIAGLSLPLRAKIGREKINISDTSGKVLTMAASDRPNLLTLTSEDGYQSLVSKEQVLDIVK